MSRPALDCVQYNGGTMGLVMTDSDTDWTRDNRQLLLANPATNQHLWYCGSVKYGSQRVPLEDHLITIDDVVRIIKRKEAFCLLLQMPH